MLDKFVYDIMYHVLKLNMNGVIRFTLVKSNETPIYTMGITKKIILDSYVYIIGVCGSSVFDVIEANNISFLTIAKVLKKYGMADGSHKFTLDEIDD